MGTKAERSAPGATKRVPSHPAEYRLGPVAAPTSPVGEKYRFGHLSEVPGRSAEWARGDRIWAGFAERYEPRTPGTGGAPSPSCEAL